MSEEFTFENEFGKRRAVDGDERPVGARTEAVDHVCDHFLTGTTLPKEEHRAVCGCDLPDELDHALHRGSTAD